MFRESRFCPVLHYTVMHFSTTAKKNKINKYCFHSWSELLEPIKRLRHFGECSVSWYYLLPLVILIPVCMITTVSRCQIDGSQVCFDACTSQQTLLCPNQTVMPLQRTIRTSQINCQLFLSQCLSFSELNKKDRSMFLLNQNILQHSRFKFQRDKVPC